MRHKESHGRLSERIVAELSAKALVNNYASIQDQVPGQSILPMVKANGYGHGAAWVSRLLLEKPGLYGFGVATLAEGAELRQELGARGRRTRILVCSGAAPWTEEIGQYCEKFRLTPMIATDHDWKQFFGDGWAERIPYELKFNTGMNRLGISPGLAPAIARALRNRGSTEHPEGVLSHLAMGEDPEARLSQVQREKFAAIRTELSGAFPSAHFHLANSAAIWKQKNWRLKDLTDVVRPGLSLYGIVPWQGAPERGIQPVMNLKARVIATHRLKSGDSVGYGASFTASGSEPEFVAVVAAGYADGIRRSLSNQGHVWVEGKPSQFVGRVSMDLATVRCSQKMRPGDWVEILGPHVDPWAQAQAAGTIPYELLTSISPRVQRIYE